ncbi:MAG: DUF2381 family protein [Kofleriaceae bacterium]
MQLLQIFLGLVCVLAAGETSAQPSPSKAEAEYLVPPQGGAYEVRVHVGAVCILSFPEKMASKALASSPDFEIKSWGDDGVAVRAINDKVTTATLALATSSGGIKVNVTLRVVPKTAPALTLVRFKAASTSEAFEALVKAEVAKRMAPIEAELAKARRNVDAQIRDRADGLLADRLLKRNELIQIAVHERNDDHVIVHVRRGQLLGEDGYLLFEIENRSSAAYRLASVRVTSGGRDVAGPARLASTAVDRDLGMIGIVPAGATARGVVVVRSVDSVLGKSLALELAGPEGRGKVRLERGIVLR